MQDEAEEDDEAQDDKPKKWNTVAKVKVNH